MEPVVKFWMVYRDDGRAPTFRHLTKENARREATRLAEDNPGKKFFVLAAVEVRTDPVGFVESLKMRKATEEEILDSEIPF